MSFLELVNTTINTWKSLQQAWHVGLDDTLPGPVLEFTSPHVTSALQGESCQVYLIRQRIALEALPRTAFLTCRRVRALGSQIRAVRRMCITLLNPVTRMTWADFPLRHQ